MTAGHLAAQVAANAKTTGDTSVRSLVAYQERVQQALGRRLGRNYSLRARFPPDKRASRKFVRLFAVAAGGK
jgi:flavin-dependent dehydrogenase